MTVRPLRIAIAGAGYVADFHFHALKSLAGVELVSVCDPNLKAAQTFGAKYGLSQVYDSMESMLSAESLDAIQILAPPDKHHALAKSAIQSGVNVFLEKPMCTTVEEADELLNLARERGVHIGVNHNFLFSACYRRLREIVRSNDLGPIDHLAINYFFELPQIRFGPYDSWMLREPGNVMLETGPHLVSAVLDLVGPLDEISVQADRKIKIPGGRLVYRRWRVQSSAGRTAVEINVNLGPTFGQRTISVHGMTGTAVVDLDANICIVDRRTPLSSDFDRYRRSRSVAGQVQSQSRKTMVGYVLSKLKLRSGGNPYQASITDSVAAFYRALRANEQPDRRIDGAFGRDVVAGSARIVDAAKLESGPAITPGQRRAPKTQPTVLVLGGSGFIGRELVRQLLASGYSVRTMTRGPAGSLEEFDLENLEIVRGDITDPAALKVAMQSMEFVYDLTTSEAKTWDDGLRFIVEPARVVANTCLAAGVKRLIYTGTIASYYAGARAGVITEQTQLDERKRRNYYARAKTMAESVLMDMHRTKRLPVVIFRPGIVIGKGGNPFHWGVGRFTENVCEVWGDGNNKLPFVLVSDVAKALVCAIDAQVVEGRSYNLVDVPLLSARDYLNELQRLTDIRLDIYFRPIWRFYAADLMKWAVKIAVGHPDRIRIPSYPDWESRTHKAIFNCGRAQEELAWTPASDRQRLIDEGIGLSVQSWLASVR